MKETFRSGITRPLEWRREQLYQLARLAKDNSDALAESLLQDLGKPKLETLFAEVSPIVSRSVTSAEKLDEWSKPELVDVPDFQKPWTPTIHKVPKGVVLAIAYISEPQPTCVAIANKYSQTLELSHHTVAPAIDWSHCCRMLCHHQTI